MISVLSCGLVMLVLLLVDLLTKAWAEASRIAQPDYFLGIVRLSYTENTGAAFGSWSNTEWVMKFLVTPFTVVMIVAIGVLFFTMFRKNTPVRMCLAIVEAGAVGNLVDRLCLGYVRDFVDVQPLGFGVCNIADFCITFAAIALVIIILFIGPHAVFPLTKKWRDQAQAEEERKGKKPAAETAVSGGEENTKPPEPKEEQDGS